jgi:hypothetical protein
MTSCVSCVVLVGSIVGLSLLTVLDSASIASLRLATAAPWARHRFVETLLRALVGAKTEILAKTATCRLGAPHFQNRDEILSLSYES